MGICACGCVLVLELMTGCRCWLISRKCYSIRNQRLRHVSFVALPHCTYESHFPGGLSVRTCCRVVDCSVWGMAMHTGTVQPSHCCCLHCCGCRSGQESVSICSVLQIVSLFSCGSRSTLQGGLVRV